ncbi:replication initiator protein A [bacterium AH-315-J19]|nr:replication initiator protein A [bacterium AH-315-J19]
MVCETTKEKSPLLPDRLTQGDFFVCDIFDAAPKGDMASMAHPIFSISTKPDRRIRRYENGKNFIEITPSVKGLATVHDRDILIFCISQIMAALNTDQKVSQKVRFKAFDMLTATNRPTGGESYERLKEALERLSGTRITTNITTGDIETFDGFGLIDRFRIVRETREGRMQEIEISLSDWVFNAIQHREVLTLNRNYFRLRKPMERRLYELARKHCGQQKQWRVSLAILQNKCGSSSTAKEFKRLVLNIIKQDEEHNHLPDYSIRFDGDKVVFRNRGTMNKQALEHVSAIKLDTETYQHAKLVAPSWDIYYLEDEWRGWIMGKGLNLPKSPDKAFIGFCKKWYAKHGRA